MSIVLGTLILLFRVAHPWISFFVYKEVYGNNYKDYLDNGSLSHYYFYYYYTTTTATLPYYCNDLYHHHYYYNY